MSTKRTKPKHASTTNGHKDAAPSSVVVVDTSKPTATYQPTKGRAYTVSIAIPGSIIAKSVAPSARSRAHH